MAVREGQTITVSPSDFAWLYEKCKRCYWLKLQGAVLPTIQPSQPAVFRAIDKGMKLAVTAEVLQSLGLPVASRIAVRGRVTSQPYQTSSGVFIVVSGFPDGLYRLEDETALLVDYKTTKPKDTTLGTYKRQVHGYELAVRAPASGAPIEVSQLGLVCFDPRKFTIGPNVQSGAAPAANLGYVTYTPQELDRSGFETFLDRIGELAVQPVPPPPTPGCAVCSAFQVLLENIKETQ